MATRAAAGRLIVIKVIRVTKHNPQAIPPSRQQRRAMPRRRAQDGPQTAWSFAWGSGTRSSGKTYLVKPIRRGAPARGIRPQALSRSRCGTMARLHSGPQTCASIPPAPTPTSTRSPWASRCSATGSTAAARCSTTSSAGFRSRAATWFSPVWRTCSIRWNPGVSPRRKSNTSKATASSATTSNTCARCASPETSWPRARARWCFPPNRSCGWRPTCWRRS